jgi:5-formyltetrahydrofolate cyclo-ligase
MTKSELRKIYLEKRSALTSGELGGSSREIARRFFESFDLSTVRTLHCFVPIKRFKEIDTSLIYERIWRDLPQIRTIAPRVDRKIDDVRNLEFTSNTELIENAWGIREPASGESIDPAEIDMVLVPLLCFDERGYRVGYGKGFYDKFLSRCRPDCQMIGLSYFPPVGFIDDLAEYDVRLDRCITPTEIFSSDFE